MAERPNIADLVQMQEVKDGRYVEGYFQKGNKSLKVTLHPSGMAYGNLVTREGLQRVPGSTTDIYRSVEVFFKKKATERNQTIEYNFSTRIETMKAWLSAPDKGGSVLSWKGIMEKEGTLYAYALVMPEEAEQKE